VPVIAVPCSDARSANQALCWSAVLCQHAGLRMAAQRDAGELVEDAVEALDTYQDCVLHRPQPRMDLMFNAPWRAQ